VRYVEAPARLVHSGRSVFLAGGITGCPDWQADAVRALAASPYAVFNPRRRTGFADPVEQIAWEYEHLRVADVVLFWFAAGQVQPIALYELGAMAALGKPLAVGADPGYPRRLDVTVQLGLARPDLRLHADLPATVAEALSLLAHPSGRPG
jgi:Nucleoside 2-deoxyribosyltransferase like